MKIDYEFHEGKFTEAEITIASDPSRNWEQDLNASGWFRVLSIPNHEEAYRFNDITATIYGTGSQRMDDPPYLADVWIGDSGFCMVRCPTAVDLLMLIRDWLHPLCGNADREAFLGKLDTLIDYLTDPQTGLECVRLGKKRERELREYYRERRKAQKKETA